MSGTPQIQGRNTVLKVFINGRAVLGVPVKSFDDKGKQEFRSRDLLGEERESTQLLVHGYQGTFELDVDSKRRHEISEYLNNLDKAGVGAAEIAIQCTERYKDGTNSRYRFVRVTLGLPETTVRGRKDDVTSRIEWHAEDKIYL